MWADQSNQNALNAGPTSLRVYATRIAGYAIAIAIVWWLARKIPPAELVATLLKANLWYLLPTCAFSVMCWVVGESLLYSRLITYFHRPTSFREMLPINAAQEFFQVVNKAAAGSALALYMHRCKGAGWMSAGCTLIFQGLVDVTLLIAMSVIASVAAPAAILGVPRWLPCVALIVLVSAALVARYGANRSVLVGWLVWQPALETFRNARLSHYVGLMVIRTPIFLAQGLVLYLELLSFGLRVPIIYVFAFIPTLTLLSSVPMAPGGIGPRQAVTVVGLAAFGPKASLLAMSLAHSLGSIAFRLPLGFFAGNYFRRIIPAKS